MARFLHRNQLSGEKEKNALGAGQSRPVVTKHRGLSALGALGRAFFSFSPALEAYGAEKRAKAAPAPASHDRGLADWLARGSAPVSLAKCLGNASVVGGARMTYNLGSPPADTGLPGVVERPRSGEAGLLAVAFSGGGCGLNGRWRCGMILARERERFLFGLGL